MLDGSKETIYALSTPAGRGGVAVIRVSGPAAVDCLTAFQVTSLPKPRVATRAVLRRKNDGATVDDGLILFFPGPNSFTG